MLVGANYFSGEQLEYSTVPAVFWEYIVRVLAVFRGSVLRILSILPRISGFDTADTPVLAVLLLLILPVLAVFRPSVLLILPVLAVFRPSVLLILPLLAVRNVLHTPEYILEVRSILGSSVKSSMAMCEHTVGLLRDFVVVFHCDICREHSLIGRRN